MPYKREREGRADKIIEVAWTWSVSRLKVNWLQASAGAHTEPPPPLHFKILVFS